MKRLTEDTELPPNEHKLAELFRAASPFEVDPFRKRRVLVRLSRERPRARLHFWRSPVALVVLLVSGSAAAEIGHRYVAHGGSIFGLVLPGPKVSVPAPSAQAVVHASAAPSKPGSALAAAPSASAALSEESAAHEAAPALDAASARPAQKSLPARPSASEDPTHVVEAIQALRTDKDPSRARGLLNDYLKTHPNGVLSEDALALSIEAASAQHDPKAADYAKRYLAKFPHGKYSAMASRALAQAGH